MKVTKIVLLFLVFSLQLFAQEKKWTLKECIHYAIENNISVTSSTLDAKTTAISKTEAIMAFLPTINASGSHSWNIGLNQNITTGLLENQTTQFTSAGLNLGVDIFKGLQNQNRLRRANLANIASQYQVAQIKEDIALNVTNAYLQILFNKENLKVQQQQLQLNTDQLNRTQDLVTAGAVPQGDLLDIKATVAVSKQNVISAENALLLSKMSLAQLLTIENFKTFDVATDEITTFQSPVLNENPQQIIEKAKQNRTEIKLAQSNVEIAKKDIAIAKGSYYPTLSGYYSFSTRASYADRITGSTLNTNNPTSVIGYVQNTNNLVVQPNYIPITGAPRSLIDQFDDNKGQNFGLQLSIPVFNGLAARTNVERTKIAYQKATLNAKQQSLNLEQSVYTAYTDTKSAQKSYEAALETLNAKKLAFDYAQERYNIGLIDVFSLNQVKNTLVEAESNTLKTKYDYIFKTKILEFYFGIPLIENN